MGVEKGKALAPVPGVGMHSLQDSLSLEEARRVVAGFVEYYNTMRLHCALGYVTPQDKLQRRPS